LSLETGHVLALSSKLGVEALKLEYEKLVQRVDRSMMSRRGSPQAEVCHEQFACKSEFLSMSLMKPAREKRRRGIADGKMIAPFAHQAESNRVSHRGKSFQRHASGQSDYLDTVSKFLSPFV
jgi:hypothetical protein